MDEGLSGRTIYKGDLIKWVQETRRPRRGYLPTKRLDFRDDSKGKDPLRIWQSKKWA